VKIRYHPKLTAEVGSGRSTDDRRKKTPAPSSSNPQNRGGGESDRAPLVDHRTSPVLVARDSNQRCDSSTYYYYRLLHINMSQDTANEPGNVRNIQAADLLPELVPEQLLMNSGHELPESYTCLLCWMTMKPPLGEHTKFQPCVQWLLNRLTSTGNGGCLSVLQDIRSGKRRGYGCPGQETRGCEGSQSH